MGAETFMVCAHGLTIRAAFRRAVRLADAQHGPPGETGTITEKDTYVLIPIPTDWRGTAESYAWHLLDTGDARIIEKGGPAGALQLGPRAWLFFGWAPS